MSRTMSGLILTAVFICAAQQSAAQNPTRTWNYMTTGNGHGFQVFDRGQNRIVSFLEHPYRYVAPGDDQRTWGIGRRDLAHDIYFGLRIGGNARWLHDGYDTVEYEEQTHVIHATVTFQDAFIDTYYLAPFGFAGNGMLMLIRVRNDGANAMNLSLYSKPNLKLGQGRVNPDDLNEDIQFNDAAPVHGVETGPGGGHAIYVPIGGLTRASCGSDSDLYNDVLQNGNIGTNHSCSGAAQVLVLQHDFSVAAGESAWWGQAVLFVNDNPDDPRANLFKDDRSVSDLISLWDAFAGDKTAETMHSEALAEFEHWRADLAPAQLDATEVALWRQSEAILRMGQVRERPGENQGMMLASLPIGEWHTGWVRDAVYGIVALAMTGHTEEARLGVEFYIGADSGFFSDWNGFIGRDYRISTCRYFGNGYEEADFNQDGPNLETDGWGLVLWAAKLVLHYSCDLTWLDDPTWKGDTVFEALHGIAQDIEDYSSGNLPGRDASIWEVHWDYRQVFGYTAAAQIRGLFDFADIAQAYGRTDLSDHYRTFAQNMLDTSKTALVHDYTQSFASHMGVAGDDVHVDGSTVAFLDWRLIDESDPLYTGTLNQFSKLLTGFGGYRRLEPQLSLTGGGSASEYDLSEWILLDLRIGDCWRRMGNTSQADGLLDKVTESAAVNDNLVPELFDPDDGRYTGVVPMVGYGAGAWMMSQLEKFGAPAPGIQVDFSHCSACAQNPCTGDHEQCLDDGAGGYTCQCRPGYHYEAEVCVEDTECDPATTCDGHGQCTGVGLECDCDPGYTGDHCTDCDTGYHLDGSDCVEDTPCNPNPCSEPNKSVCIEEGESHRCECNPGYLDDNGTCVEEGGQDPTFDDGAACVCGRGSGSTRAGWSLFLGMVIGLALLRRKRVAGFVILLLIAGLTSLPALAQEPEEETPVDLNRPRFPEDGTGQVDGWAFGFHGYARMPLRMHGSPGSPRPPYLVDDDYYLSGFAYTRINETEWAELFLSAETGRTRFVLGLFSSQFSDWSETTLQGQGGVSTAFVEHYWDIMEKVELGVRAGMFWDRNGFVPRYDTYLMGRMHMAGLRLKLRLYDLVYLKIGYGAHADVINANQGFTPVAYLQTGVDLGWLDLSLFLGSTWTSDSEREFSIVEDGSLRVIGGEARVAIPKTGPLSLTLAHLHAENVVFLANAFEILHSTGGRGLTQNFFGPDSDNGTGEIFAASLDFTWEPARLVPEILDGLEVHLFGMLARVASNQWSDNPLENFHQRTYFKWGFEPFYRLPLDGWTFLFFSIRYDRVILDSDHESLSFRIVTPRIGVTPIQDLKLDIFLSYSAYSYGENIRLRPNQIPGDLSVTQPDDQVLKLQAQASW